MTYFLFPASLLTLSCMKIPLKRCRNSRSEGWTSRNLAASEDFWIPWCSSFSGKTMRVGQLPRKKKKTNFLTSYLACSSDVMHLRQQKRISSKEKKKKTQREIRCEVTNFSIESKFTCQIPLQHCQVLHDQYHPLQCLQVRRLRVLMYRYLDTSLQSTGVVCSQQDRFWRQNECDNHWNGLPDYHWPGKPTWNRCLFALKQPIEFQFNHES